MTTLLPPAPRISLVDGSGNMTRPWTLYFQAVFERLGGAIAPSNDDLARMLAAALPASLDNQGESESVTIQVSNPTQQPTPITFIMMIEECYDEPVYIPLR